MRADSIDVYTGNANPELAAKIARYLGRQIGKAEVFAFANENIFVKILDNAREKDVFIVQPTSRPVSTSIMELLIMIDAFKRASAGRITAVIPYYGYGRSDKKDQPRVPIAARLVADMIESAGADRYMTFDPHAGQIQGFFNIPVDHLYAAPAVLEDVKARFTEDLVVVSPDAGGTERARAFAKRLNAGLAIIDKRRSAANVSEVMHIIGDVQGRDCIIVDDMIDTAGTITKAADALFENGAIEVIATSTHGVLSGPAVERLTNSRISEVVITDTLPIPPEHTFDKLTVLSIAPLLARAIHEVFDEGSVASLFDHVGV